MAAAEGGCPRGQFELAYAYQRGEGGLPQSWELTVKWLLKSAEGGNAMGQRELGGCYSMGNGGLVPNLATSVAWYRKAALQGDMHAQYYLGMAYFGGSGARQDINLAKEWLKKAAAQGHEHAQTTLGMISLIPVHADTLTPEDFLSGLTDAAEHGDPNAQHRLATLHRSGDLGVERDARRARELLKASASQGNSSAATSLTSMRACACCGTPHPRFMCQRYGGQGESLVPPHTR